MIKIDLSIREINAWKFTAENFFRLVRDARNKVISLLWMKETKLFFIMDERTKLYLISEMNKIHINFFQKIVSYSMTN